MNPSSIIFCQTEEGWLRPDSVVAAFATTAADGVQQPFCTRSAMKARAENHFVGLHEMVPSVQPRGVGMTHSKDHSEEHLEMVQSEQATVRAEIRDYLEGLRV
jgi:hypothetical protein